MVAKFLSIPAALCALLLFGCKQAPPAAEVTAEGLTKIKVGYIGLTCEAPVFVAMEKGFFKEEGLEVEAVKCDWAQFKDVLGLGGFHVGHQPIMMFLKPIEQGLDVKMTAGIHLGCLRVQAPVDGSIHTVQDLRGKRIGVPGMGTPPFIFANRVLGGAGIDSKNEIEWRVFPAGELGLALQKGEIDAIATAEPIGALLLAEGKVKTIADQSKDVGFAGEFCCGVLINGQYLATNPKASAAATRAIVKGAKWVETNPRAAAQLSLDKGYVASHVELNTQVLGSLRYVPSLSGGKDSLRTTAEGMQAIGMLSATMNVAEAINRIFADLEGVTDEWVKNLEVEKVAGGQVPADQAQRVALELATLGAPLFVESCCEPLVPFVP